MTSTYFSNLKEFIEGFDESSMEKVLWHIVLRTPLGKVFNYLDSKDIDLRLLIGEYDNDTFERGRFAYITVDNMIELYEKNSSSISYGIGFESHYEVEADDPDFYEEDRFSKLEKLIINSLKRHKITCTNTLQIWEEGMHGSEVDFNLNVDFKSYFSESEIKLMSSYMNELSNA